MSPQTPPTDRPLTAGDVPLLREGDLLRARNGKLLSYAYTDKKGWAFCDGFGPPIDRDAHTLESFTFVSRPATSAASEGEDKANHDCLAKRRPGEPMFILLGRDPDAHTIVQLWADRRLAAGGDPDHCRMGYDTAERMAAYAKDPANKPASAPDAVDYPALASPPVSERERELEGALRLAVTALSCLTFDDEIRSVIGNSNFEILRANYAALRVLTAQPAGEGK